MGASGNTYELACAVGTINESRRAAVTAAVPSKDFFEVDFMGAINREIS